MSTLYSLHTPFVVGFLVFVVVFVAAHIGGREGYPKRVGARGQGPRPGRAGRV